MTMNAFSTSKYPRFHRREFLGATAIAVAAAPFANMRVAAAQATEKKPADSILQPAAKIIANPPLPEPLARGVAFIEYRVENLRIVPVFGPKAAELSPRIGHLHVTLDDTPWHWADTSGNPIIVAPLPAGPHKIEIVVVNANHQPLHQTVVEFVVPKRAEAPAHATHD
jgi:hypothetical protein